MDTDSYNDLRLAKRRAIKVLSDICSEGEAPVEVIAQAAIALLQYRPQTVRVFKSAEYQIKLQPTSENRETAGDRSLC